jgi:hypothetical protein
MNVQSNDKIVARDRSGPSPSDSIGTEPLFCEYPVLRGELGYETRDVLRQLNSNLNQLENLVGHLSFVLSEVRGLVRR